jgi:WD40 repeat protein
LASGSRDNTIKLWDVNRGNLRQTLTGHSYSVFSVAFSLDGQTLASGSRDDTIKIWQVASLTNTATSSSIKPTQFNIPQPAVSTPHTQPVITQPPIKPTTTSLFTSIEVFFLLVWLGDGVFFVIVGSIRGSAWFVLPLGVFLLLFALLCVLIRKLNRQCI